MMTMMMRYSAKGRFLIDPSLSGWHGMVLTTEVVSRCLSLVLGGGQSSHSLIHHPLKGGYSPREEVGESLTTVELEPPLFISWGSKARLEICHENGRSERCRLEDGTYYEIASRVSSREISVPGSLYHISVKINLTN